MRLLIFVIFTLVGCAARPVQFYPGPRLEPAMVSLIQCQLQSTKVGRLTIQKVDGRELKKPLTYIEVLPYKHKITVSYVYGQGISEFSSGRPCILKIPCEAGKTYVIDASANIRERTWKSWVIETSSGEQLDLCVRKVGEPESEKEGLKAVTDEE